MENNSLQHYGIPNMKWGVRRYQNKDGSLTPAGKKRYDYSRRIARGHAGPGIYLGKKRQLAGAKRDLEYLNNGGHLSVGLTKKRQDAYDERDRKLLEKKISKLEADAAAKTAKKQAKVEKKLSSMSDDARTASDLKKKKPSEMSNAELKKLNDRVRLEQEYSRLNPNTVQKGWKVVVATAGVMGTALAVYNNGHQLVNIGKAVVEKVKK